MHKLVSLLFLRAILLGVQFLDSGKTVKPKRTIPMQKRNMKNYLAAENGSVLNLAPQIPIRHETLSPFCHSAKQMNLREMQQSQKIKGARRNRSNRVEDDTEKLPAEGSCTKGGVILHPIMNPKKRQTKA